MEMDLFISCPYNACHRVPKLRIQAHILKCPNKRPEWVACPYNATHRMPEPDIKCHVLSCPSRKEMYPEDNPSKVTSNIMTPKFLLQKDFLPVTDPDDEIWDE